MRGALHQPGASGTGANGRPRHFFAELAQAVGGSSLRRRASGPGRDRRACRHRPRPGRTGSPPRRRRGRRADRDARSPRPASGDPTDSAAACRSRAAGRSATAACDPPRPAPTDRARRPSAGWRSRTGCTPTTRRRQSADRCAACPARRPRSRPGVRAARATSALRGDVGEEARDPFGLQQRVVGGRDQQRRAERLDPVADAAAGTGRRVEHGAGRARLLRAGPRRRIPIPRSRVAPASRNACATRASNVSPSSTISALCDDARIGRDRIDAAARSGEDQRVEPDPRSYRLGPSAHARARPARTRRARRGSDASRATGSAAPATPVCRSTFHTP